MRLGAGFMGTEDSATPIALWQRRLSRRRLLAHGTDLALLSALIPVRVVAQRGAPFGFDPVSPSSEDAVVVPPGYRADVLIRWGEPLFADTPALDAGAVARGALLRPDAAREHGPGPLIRHLVRAWEGRGTTGGRGGRSWPRRRRMS